MTNDVDSLLKSLCKPRMDTVLQNVGISDFRGLLLESSFASELDSDRVEKHLQQI